jgi:hypothetical protein
MLLGATNASQCVIRNANHGAGHSLRTTGSAHELTLGDAVPLSVALPDLRCVMTTLPQGDLVTGSRSIE